MILKHRQLKTELQNIFILDRLLYFYTPQIALLLPRLIRARDIQLDSCIPCCLHHFSGCSPVVPPTPDCSPTNWQILHQSRQLADPPPPSPTGCASSTTSGLSFSQPPPPPPGGWWTPNGSSITTGLTN